MQAAAEVAQIKRLEQAALEGLAAVERAEAQTDQTPQEPLILAAAAALGGAAAVPNGMERLAALELLSCP